jgi:intraflagellar transport protein 46
MDSESEESSSNDEDELRDSEESDSEESSSEEEGAKPSGRNDREVKNMPFDEALDVSASMDASADPGAKAARDREVKNMPFDEALEVSASMSHAAESQAQGRGAGSMKNKPFDEAMDLSEEESSVDTNPSPRNPSPRREQAKAAPAKAAVESESDNEESSSEEEDEESEAKDTKPAASTAAPAAIYNAKDMEHLNVSAEIKELFQYIQRYKPHDVELESQLKCFIPDYIPSVGQIDAFLKVPRPDGVSAELGLKVLDEPAAVQSDSTVLELQMRAISKKQHGEANIRSIDDPSKNPKEIQRWIDSINDLHRSKPPMQVNYAKSMPEIEPLMQVWPEDFEEVLKNVDLPGVDMDMSLHEYARFMCVMLDIPVHKVSLT